MPNDESNHETNHDYPEFTTSPGEENSNLEVPEDEILEYERAHKRGMGMRGIRGVLAALIIVGGLGVGWWVYSGFAGPDEQTDVPLVQADATPFKARPESPGGLDVPDQDKLVYNRLSPDSPEPEPERLLAPPEKPMMPPQMAEGADDTPQPAAMDEEPAPAKSETVAKAEPAEAKTVERAAAALKPAAKSPPAAEKPAPAAAMEAKPVPERPKVSAPDPAKPQPAATPAPAPPQQQLALANAYQIQLASVRSREAAANEWSRLQDKYPELLGKLRFGVMRADLGQKGVFYRLRAGPLSDQTAARNLCKDLSRKKVGCLVVSPGS